MHLEKEIPHLGSYLEVSARKSPDRICVVGPKGRAVTYTRLDDEANRVARFLLAAGVRPGDRVGLILPKSIEALIALFGILKARAAYVPADWTSPVERNVAVLRDCDVRVLFLDSRLAHALSSTAGRDLCATVVLVSPGSGGLNLPRGFIGWHEVLSYPSQVVDVASRRRDDLAFILYTSGSTGMPKGVMLTHENASVFVEWCSETFLPVEEDRFSSHAPFHFDLSVLDVYVSIRHGASLHLIAEDMGRNPRLVARFIAARRITVWYSAPAILAMMAQSGRLEGVEARSLRLMLFAGEVFPVKYLRRLVSIWPHPIYYNLYGPTETNVCTYARIPTPIPEDREEPFPIGQPCSHCDIMVLDEAGDPVTEGEQGLLHTAGPSVFAGYWNRPRESAERFRERNGRRFYNTGDVVTEVPGDGYLYVGRRDRMVKRRGNRIELGEIEHALYRHERVTEVAVIARSEGAGLKITACVVTPSSERPSLIAFKSFCAQVLPSYMIPDAFVFLDRLPRTSTDKVDYQGLTRLPGNPPV